jgi:hypothetical protein
MGAGAADGLRKAAVPLAPGVRRTPRGFLVSLSRFRAAFQAVFMLPLIPAGWSSTDAGVSCSGVSGLAAASAGAAHSRHAIAGPETGRSLLCAIVSAWCPMCITQ